MNQQRGRRFRTAKTAIILEERAKALGESLPTEARFDSNCITPGTEFMARLHSVLQGFVAHKISADKLWQNVRVYLSGHETPGEGEHKIMDFIRYEKSQPGYNPNTRHCLYGLDADLIMLGLCSHEPYFSLLREEVKFGGKKNQKRIMTPEETTFHLLHISLLRDYLYHEFSSVKDKISFEFNVENIVDDFVLMSFLVGNDFIPHLPQLHIHHDALPVLFRTYMDVLPTIDGYINEQGSLNLSHFEVFMKKLSEYDFKKFNELNDDFQYLNEKSKNKDEDNYHCDEEEKKNTADILSGLGFSSLAVSKMAEFDSSFEEDDDDNEKDSVSDDCDSLELELFNMHKTDYYLNKLEFSEVTPDILKDQAEGYVRAIQWNLHYYYNGVMSWSWYYPHHYSPYISDVKDFKNMEMKFELGKPFLPFQQLLAVLPKLSKDLLPVSYQKLMCDIDSPLIDYYPDDFETDLNGKQQEWEAIVLIPFINEKLLLKFAAEADKELNDDEMKRNCHGPHLLYTYNPKSSGGLPSFLPEYYPPLSQAFFNEERIDPDFFRLPCNLIYKGLPKGVVLDKIILGFPTLKTIEHTAELKNEKVKVFQMVSMKENMMLTIKESFEIDLLKVAKKIVGKIIHVGWPHLREAFVVAVSDKDNQVVYDRSKSSSNRIAVLEKEMTSDEKKIWEKQIEGVEEHNYQRWGIYIGNTKILIHVKCLSGKRIVCSKEGKLVEEKQWDGTLCNFALQATVSHIEAFSPDDSDKEKPIDIFSPNAVVFVLSPPYYGSMGTVINSRLDIREPTVLVDVEISAEPDLMPIIQNQDDYKSEQYMPGYVAAQQLGVETYFVSHLTGTILIQTSPKGSSSPNRVNVGLNLKFNRKGEEVVGYTMKKENTWLYSNKAVKLLNAYLSEFPDFFEILFKYVKDDVIYLEDMYPNGEGHELINKIAKWLKSQASALADRQKVGMIKLDVGIVKEIENLMEKNKGGVYHVKKDFSPNELFSPFMCKGITKPDPNATFNLFDRVVSINYSSCVPVGLKGTIIGMSSEEEESDIMYEIVFDKEFFGGLSLSCSPGKGYRLPAYSLINITHGLRMGQKPTKQSPAKKSKANYFFNRSAASDAILKHLQSDNRISDATQYLQKKPHTSPSQNRPFYSVNEMFQTQTQDATPPKTVFSPNLTEASGKQFVTPKAGYVTSSFTGKSLVKKNTQSPSQANYQDFWADLKKNTPEPSARIQQEPSYGQKLSIEELFPSVDCQKETKYELNNFARLSSEPQIVHRTFVDKLLQMCVQYFKAPPHYTYHNYGNTYLFIASISLPNGMKVSGVPCEQKHEAAVSAAEKAVASLQAQTSLSRNDLYNAQNQNNNIRVDKAIFNRQNQVVPNNFCGPRFVYPPPYQPHHPQYPYESPQFERPLMRHPSPSQASRMADSFVISNQRLLSNAQVTLPPSASRQTVAPPDPELFHIPGGGTARVRSKIQPVTAISDSSNLFVPNQVLKQAVKTPFDSPAMSSNDWPELPSKSELQPNKMNNSKSGRTCSEALKSELPSSAEKTQTPNPSMTLLKKNPPKRRIAANFQNP